MIKGKNTSTQDPIPSKNNSSAIKVEIKTILDEGKLREFVASRPAVKELLKEDVQKEG